MKIIFINDWFLCILYYDIYSKLYDNNLHVIIQNSHDYSDFLGTRVSLWFYQYLYHDINHTFMHNIYIFNLIKSSQDITQTFREHVQNINSNGTSLEFLQMFSQIWKISDEIFIY